MQLICDPMNLKPRKVRRSGGGGDSSVWVGGSAPTRCPAVPAAPPCSGRRRKRCRLLNETFVPPLKLHLWFLRHCFFFSKNVFFPLASQGKVCPQLVGGVWPTPAALIFNAADLEGGVSAAFHYRGHFKLPSRRCCISSLLSSCSPERRSLPVFHSSNYFHQLSVIASLEFS